MRTVAAAAGVHPELEVIEVVFQEHRVNGKSRGYGFCILSFMNVFVLTSNAFLLFSNAYMRFTSAEAAQRTKVLFEQTCVLILPYLTNL